MKQFSRNEISEMESISKSTGLSKQEVEDLKTGRIGLFSLQASASEITNFIQEHRNFGEMGIGFTNVPYQSDDLLSKANAYDAAGNTNHHYTVFVDINANIADVWQNREKLVDQASFDEIGTFLQERTQNKLVETHASRVQQAEGLCDFADSELDTPQCEC